MDVREFDFDLPAEQVAQEPPTVRGGARLLHLDRQTGLVTHRHVAHLPHVLQPGDLLVVNNTRVFPARLLGRRTPSGGAVECFLVRALDGPEAATTGEGAVDAPPRPGEEIWEALMHPGAKLKPGALVEFGDPVQLRGEVLARRFFGRRTIRLWPEGPESVRAVVDAIGHVPLPPYIKRADRADDRERYQTVFAAARGSVAAPTAGLHFTPELLDALTAVGVEVAEVTLHVGYGTFQPIRVERVEDHQMETEHYSIGLETAAAIARARAEGRRIIAVGTTTTRTLESVAAANGGVVVAGAGSTNLFIYPGFPFQVLSGLMTNFHLPQSSLLMLVSAFGGRERVLAAYREAVAHGYRFYSYGDAMLVL